MTQSKTRYTILHLLMVTTVFAFGCATLMNESPWWRAVLTTFTLCLVLNSLIASAICRGVRQAFAFAIGFAISSFFFLISLYTLAGLETLPFLLTQLIYAEVTFRSANPPSEDHFYIVSVLLWGLGCAYSGGLLARRWYFSRQVVNQPPSPIQS